MSHRKILFLDKNTDEVKFILDLNDDDLINAGLIAGLLSNPEFIEIQEGINAGLGWKWDGTNALPPVGGN